MVTSLHLMLLTFVRNRELREASWAEFNLEQAEWRMPAQRIKMRDAHLVPLSKQAVKLLRELYTLTGRRDYILPNDSDPSRCMTATTLNRALERMGLNEATQLVSRRTAFGQLHPPSETNLGTESK